jgi:8-oxo-dGTP pyrophosphatase MutT (NUDIX family)
MRRAAGYILFHRSSGGLRFLLLRNARHGTWSFPKGHLKQEESWETGARRELAEETGITAIRPLPHFRGELRYTVSALHRPKAQADYEKHLMLFLAEVDSLDWERSPEHDAGDWLSPEVVRERLEQRDLRQVFEDALAHLESPDPPSR